MYLKDSAESMMRIGPGTPMGDLLRRFWIPALLAREVPQDGGAPVPVRLLGEDFSAVRDGHGRIMLDAYPTIVRGGVVWAYLGPDDYTPQPPDFEWSMLPESQRFAHKDTIAANWATSVEASLASDMHPIFLPPIYTSESPFRGNAYVPIDDANTCVWSWGAEREGERGPVDVFAKTEFHHLMIGLARDNARGRAPEAAAHGEWYAIRPFPISR